MAGSHIPKERELGRYPKDYIRDLFLRELDKMGQ